MSGMGNDTCRPPKAGQIAKRTTCARRVWRRRPYFNYVFFGPGHRWVLARQAVPKRRAVLRPDLGIGGGPGEARQVLVPHDATPNRTFMGAAVFDRQDENATVTGAAG